MSNVTRISGYCGIICSDCPVLLATQKNDNLERKKVADLFTRQYGEEYKPEDINCDGCTGNGQRVFRYCKLCGIRKCGMEKKIKNCAFCSEYHCEKLSELFGAYPKARENLDGIRREHGIT